jgi:hypothetical protein
MSADGTAHNPRNDPLQFDVAESSATAGAATASSTSSTSCKSCAKPIVGVYYQVNRFIICSACRNAYYNPNGSSARRVLRAAAFGTIAAIGGSLLYFAVAAITGREFGLVAIVVGYMVGIAVRKGSRGRGGWPYQSLAIALTYLAIVTSYVPLIAKEFQKNSTRSALRAHSAPVPMADTITISARGPEIGREIDSASAAHRSADSSFTVFQAGTPSAAATRSRERGKHIGPGTFLLGIGALLLLAAAIPILAGFSNIIGLVIIGFAVYEAWKLNRRLTITGPFRLAVSQQTGTIG